MKIKWITDVTLDVVVNFDEATEETTTETETFKAGEICDVDLLGEQSDSIDIQFGCGDCCYGIRRTCFEIIEPEII